jgi:hypothetical protein
VCLVAATNTLLESVTSPLLVFVFVHSQAFYLSVCLKLCLFVSFSPVYSMQNYEIVSFDRVRKVFDELDFFSFQYSNFVIVISFRMICNANPICGEASEYTCFV